MRSMLRLTGATEFSFETGSAAYQRYASTRGSRWPEQERLGRTPALQHVGLATAEITLDGVIYPGRMGGLQEDLRKLRGLCLSDSPFQMVTGTGQVCGFWAVLDVSDTRTIFLDNGLARKIEFTIKLKYYGTDYQGGKGNVGALTGSIASSPSEVANSLAAGNLSDLPILDSVSSLDEVTAVSNAVGGVLETASSAAGKALFYASNPLALVDLASEYVPPECLSAAKEIAQTARSVLDVGQRVFDCVSAVTALPYSLAGAGSERLTAVAATLRQNLQYTRDTARLAGYGMDTVQRGLSSKGQTLSRLPDRQASAGLCLDMSGQAGSLCSACRRLDQDSSIILEKFT
ncbi:phage tail protein [uncultured Desulfovibrio sp.]|uniref:phage tail protein n=1 Tax=uncultured Desulfovibrio sp. TaxID=167968 RepID=UPI00262B7AAA|nr:phage tail protein [uncultured Desulfovibrio sp.]